LKGGFVGIKFTPAAREMTRRSNLLDPAGDLDRELLPSVHSWKLAVCSRLSVCVCVCASNQCRDKI